MELSRHLQRKSRRGQGHEINWGKGGSGMKLGLYMATQWRQGADLGTRAQEPDRAGAGCQGERPCLAHGRAAFRVEPLADVPGHAIAGAARRRGRGHAAGAGAAAAAAAQPGDRRGGNGDARLADRRQRHHRPGAGLSPGGVRFDRRVHEGARAALRRGRRGDPQAVARRRRRASRPLPYAQQGAGQRKTQEPRRAADLDGGRFRAAGQARGKARRRLVPLADGDAEGRRQG